MPYYRGDYYRGDYYRGDPGFFSFLGGIAKKAVGFIPGIGPGLSAALEGVGRHAPAAAGQAMVPFTKRIATGAAQTGAMIRRGVLKHPVLSGAGAAGVIAAGAGLGGAALEKHLLRGGRKRRRMRATNTKALRRALRRAYAFERIAMKTIHLVHPRKKGRFGGFKRPKKRVC